MKCDNKFLPSQSQRYRIRMECDEDNAMETTDYYVLDA